LNRQNDDNTGKYSGLFYSVGKTVILMLLSELKVC